MQNNWRKRKRKCRAKNTFMNLAFSCKFLVDSSSLNYSLFWLRSKDRFQAVSIFRFFTRGIASNIQYSWFHMWTVYNVHRDNKLIWNKCFKVLSWIFLYAELFAWLHLQCKWLKNGGECSQNAFVKKCGTECRNNNFSLFVYFSLEHCRLVCPSPETCLKLISR